ncbi:MAG TPA: hypothetical protein VFX37_13480 [Pseudolabrys sp.]|nr:hypothetical protein [Pseudolabrys sp.]
MRLIIPLAALLALSFASTSASAEEWCGFHDKAGAMVRCGFSSLQECKEKLESKTKDTKDIVCLPSPSFADNKRRDAGSLPAGA